MRKRNRWIFGIVVTVALVITAVIGFRSLAEWGFDLFVSQAKDALNQNAVVQKHVGTISSIEMDLAATGFADGDDVFVFQIEGPAGTGTVTAEFVTVDSDTEKITSGSLLLPSGQTIDLLDDFNLKERQPAEAE